MTKKAIGLAEFIGLSQETQLRLLHSEGVFVGKRKLGKHTVILLQLYGFYVEVFYKRYRRIIDHLVMSNDVEILQPYLDQIEVRDLNKKTKGPRRGGNR